MARESKASWCAYLLWCKDGSLYAGATNDLGARLRKHQSGKGARYTRSRLPVKLARVFRAKDRSAALKKEAALKRLDRPAKVALATVKRVRTPGRVRPRKALAPGRQVRGKTGIAPRHGG